MCGLYFHPNWITWSGIFEIDKVPFVESSDIYSFFYHSPVRVSLFIKIWYFFPIDFMSRIFLYMVKKAVVWITSFYSIFVLDLCMNSYQKEFQHSKFEIARHEMSNLNNPKFEHCRNKESKKKHSIQFSSSDKNTLWKLNNLSKLNIYFKIVWNKLCALIKFEQLSTHQEIFNW